MTDLKNLVAVEYVDLDGSKKGAFVAGIWNHDNGVVTLAVVEPGGSPAALLAAIGVNSNAPALAAPVASAALLAANRAAVIVEPSPAPAPAPAPAPVAPPLGAVNPGPLTSEEDAVIAAAHAHETAPPTPIVPNRPATPLDTAGIRFVHSFYSEGNEPTTWHWGA